MASYHSKIKDALGIVGGDCDKILNCIREKPLFIGHTSDKKMTPLVYVPDTYFLTKRKTMYTFQVFDSQMCNEKELIVDVIRAFFSFNVERAYYIVKTEEHKEKVYQIIKVLWSVLNGYFEVKENYIPSSSVIRIDIELDTTQIVDVFRNIAKKEGWGIT